MSGIQALIDRGRAGMKVVEHSVAMSRRADGDASAGRIASLWYVLRVLIAIELMHKRTRSRPLNMPGTRGWGD